MLFRGLVYGSWMARMSQVLQSGWLRSESWAYWEVLRFCCQILSVVESVSVVSFIGILGSWCLFHSLHLKRSMVLWQVVRRLRIGYVAVRCW